MNKTWMIHHKYILREIKLAFFTKQNVIQTYLLAIGGKLLCFCCVSVPFLVPETLRLRSKVYL